MTRKEKNLLEKIASFATRTQNSDPRIVYLASMCWSLAKHEDYRLRNLFNYFDSNFLSDECK